MNDNPGQKLAAIHSRELPDDPGASRHLSTDQFAGQGATSIAARSLNRTGSTGGTSMSEAAGHVANAGRGAAQLIKEGQV